MLGVNHSIVKHNRAGTDSLIRDYDFIRKDKLHQDIEFSRSSGATQTNSSGLVAFAPNNVIKASEDIINDWIIRGSVSITAGHSDPDGGTTAYLFDGLIGSGLGDAYINVRGLQPNAPLVVSFYIKKVTRLLRFADAGYCRTKRPGFLLSVNRCSDLSHSASTE